MQQVTSATIPRLSSLSRALPFLLSPSPSLIITLSPKHYFSGCVLARAYPSMVGRVHASAYPSRWHLSLVNRQSGVARWRVGWSPTRVELENNSLDERSEVFVVGPAYKHMPSVCLVLLRTFAQ